MQKTLLATLLAVSIPCAVQAQESTDYQNYKISCQAETTCNQFDVVYEDAESELAQTRRTRRTRSNDIKIFQNWFGGFGVGLLFGDGLDLGFQSSVFGATRFNEWVAAEAEVTFGIAQTEDIDIGAVTIEGESITILGFFLAPRFEYKFSGSNISIFGSPGLGISLFDGDNSEFGFQGKVGAVFDIGKSFDVLAQTRFQTEGDIFGIEGGMVFDF